MKPAGYSGKPISVKLGIRAGMRVQTRNEPDQFRSLISDVTDEAVISSRIRSHIDMRIGFFQKCARLESWLKEMRLQMDVDSPLWVAWPKKSSGVSSDISEDDIRAVALPLGLVDVKVCAIDSVWSGLKLVVRRELRQRG